MISLVIAFRFIRKSLLRTFLIILVVIIGVGVQFFISSLGSILSNMILEQATTYQEHIIVSRDIPEFYADLDFNLRDDILNDIENIQYAFYTSEVPGTLYSIDREPIIFSMLLSDSQNTINDYQHFYGINQAQNIVSGRANDPNKNEIMLDDFFARRNNIKVGDNFTFLTGNSDYSIDLTVVGTFDVGLFKFTRNYSYLTFEQFNHPIYSKHTLVIQLNNPNKLENTINTLENLIHQNTTKIYNINTWQDNLPEIHMLDLAQRAVVFVIQILISIAVFVVILSILSFSIQEKIQHMGILKAMGLDNISISRIFIIQTTFLTFIGLILGLIIGTFFMQIYHSLMTYSNGTPRFNYTLTFINYFIPSILIFISVIFATYIALKRMKNLPIIELIKSL